MRIIKTMLLASAAILLSTTALAATAGSVSGLANGEQVSLNGTVEDFDSAHSFTLRDASGTVKVDLSANKSVVLQNGEKVNITGVVDKGMLSTTVAARSVEEDKGLGQQLGEAIDSVTGQNAAAGAKAVTVQSLPDSGLVKINGSVDSVSSEKKFTLKDSTGNVDVNIKSEQSASLKAGTQVTVVGYVNKGLLGKTIEASEVDVRSSSGPMAKQ